mgnify:CR=1 FL=1
MKAVIAGSTGEIGKYLLQFLLADESFTEVTSLVRRRSLIEHQRLHNLSIDFERINELPLSKFDVLFITLGTTIKNAGSQEAFRKVDLDYVVDLAQWGKQCGASQVHIVSSMGANAKSSVFYSRVKGEMQESVKAVGIEKTYFYQPSLLDSEREEKRTGERIGVILFRLLRLLFVGPLKKYASIKVEDVAKGMWLKSKDAFDGVHIIPSDKILLTE